MIKKILIILILSFFISGCSKKTSQEILTFTSWGSITEVKVLNKIIKDFEQENPNIKINFIHTPENYFQKLHLLFASNTAPDVIFINNLYLPLYASHLEDLTNIVDKSKFYEQSLESLSYDGKILAMPRDVSYLVFYINKDIISSIRIKTLDDLLKTAQEATNEKTWGISFEEDIYYIYPYLSYFNEIFDENYDYKNSKGFKFYKDLRQKYKVAPTRSQVGSFTLAQMFLDKKIAIYLSGRWMFPKIKEKATFNWEIVSFPTAQKNFPIDASGWAISKNSKNKDLAIRFIKYLSSEKSAEYFANTGLIVPARIEASKILNNNEYNEKVFLEIIKNSKNTYIPKNYKKHVDNFNSKAFD